MSRLSFSLVDNIAGYLLDVYNIASITLPSDSAAPPEGMRLVDLTQNIWATYVKLQNVVYVADVSNECSRGAVLIHKPFGTGFVHCWGDRWGTRRVIFSRHRHKVDVIEERGTLWTTTEIQEDRTIMRIKTDVRIFPRPFPFTVFFCFVSSVYYPFTVFSLSFILLLFSH